MPKYEITLSRQQTFFIEVEADDEEAAQEIAFNEVDETQQGIDDGDWDVLESSLIEKDE